MAFTRARLIPINDRVTLIDDAGESTCYLICGDERAMLVDSVNGRENLLAVVRTVTQLPVFVVNAHGMGITSAAASSSRRSISPPGISTWPTACSASGMIPQSTQLSGPSTPATCSTWAA